MGSLKYPPGGVCRICGAEDDTRMGVCLDCASAGGMRALERTVAQHMAIGIGHLARGCLFMAKCDFRWAWERLTRTGDYRQCSCRPHNVELAPVPCPGKHALRECRRAAGLSDPWYP